MTQTNTDYLLQITPAVTDRTYGATATNDDAGKFDDHLSQAATFAGDDFHNRGSSSQRTDTARYDRDDRSWNTSASKPINSDSGSAPFSQTSATDPEQSADAVSGPKSPAEDADGDEHETETSDNATTAEVAGANQATKDSAQEASKKPEPNANAAATAKGAALGKKAATAAGDPKAKRLAEGRPTSSSPMPDAVMQHADETAKLVADAATDTAATNEEAEEPQATASEGKRSQTIKSDATTAKSNKHAIANNDGAVCNDASGDAASIEQISSEVAQKVNEPVEASATPAEVAATKGASDGDESSDEESRTSSHSETRAAARNNASIQTNMVVDTAQLAVITVSATDAGANTATKDNDNEPGTKPITAKGEPVAAAFARMTRHNMAGLNDSTSGANDLPPVDPSRFIGRVAKAFQTAQDRGGTLQLRLSPPELGALRIELNVKDGVMSASLQTENSNARRLLLDNLPALRDRLAEQNIRVDRFDVDVRREGTGEQSNARGSQHQQFQHQPDQPEPRRQAQPQQRTREVTAPERIAIEPSVSDTGLNLIV